MATYYRWRKSTIAYVPQKGTGSYTRETIGPYYDGILTQQTVYYATEAIATDANTIVLSGEIGSVTFTSTSTKLSTLGVPDGQYYFATKITNTYTDTSQTTDLVAFGTAEKCASYRVTSTSSSGSATRWSVSTSGAPIYPISIVATAGDFQEYVYSTSSSAHPNGGTQGGYYYSQRTAITSPTAPTGLTYPLTITTLSVDVSWTASISNVSAYAVTGYEVSYSTNGGSTWTVAGTPMGTNMTVSIPPTATSIQFRVRAQDSNSQWSSYATGNTSPWLSSCSRGSTRLPTSAGANVCRTPVSTSSSASRDSKCTPKSRTSALRAGKA